MSEQTSVIDLFKTFNEAQQRRPPIYQEMKEAFEHRHEGCEHSYADKSKEITSKHIEASKAIISVATAFEAIPSAHRAGALIRSLQALEKEKLHSTAEMYIFQQKFDDNKDEYDSFEVSDFEQQLKAKQKHLKQLVEDINDILDEIKEEEVSHLEAQ